MRMFIVTEKIRKYLLQVPRLISIFMGLYEHTIFAERDITYGKASTRCL